MNFNGVVKAGFPDEQPLRDVLIDRRAKLSSQDFTEILQKLGVLVKLVSAKTIVIKPNFAAGSYVSADSHVVSDTGFLRSLVENIRHLNADAEIMIAESDSTGYGFAFLKFPNLGIDTWNLPGVTTLDLSRDILSRAEDPRARYFNNIDRQLWLSSTLLNAGFVISAANLKSHSVTRFTGACKNLFGLLPVMNKEQYHTEIHDVIHDLVLAVKVDLSVVDGFYGMERNGPVQGLPVNLGYRVFSTSPVAADITCCAAIDFDFRQVRYLRLLNSVMGEVSGVEDIPAGVCRRIAPPTFWLRFFNYFGLAIQALGRDIYLAGHRIHCADSPLNFLITLVRPVLLRIFSRETLKQWKKRLVNNNE